jgi:hypothetical protein
LIVLWSCSIPCDCHLKAKVKGLILADDDLLEPAEILSDVFSAGVKQCHCKGNSTNQSITTPCSEGKIELAEEI